MRTASPVHFRRSEVFACLAYGLFVGVVAGLVGLGGAELLMPFILYFLAAPLEDMIAANILISLANSTVNLVLRARLGLLTSGVVWLSTAMVIGSVPGAYAGAAFSHRVSSRKLKGFIAFVLSVVIARLAVDFLAPASGSPAITDDLALVASGLLGFVIGMVAGGVGVAGGEYRIPVFIYLFGVPVKISGTASQLVSIPTLITAAVKHHREGSFTGNSLRIAVMLGVPSITGVLVSGFIIGGVSDAVVKLVFASIIAYTVVRLVVEVSRQRT